MSGAFPPSFNAGFIKLNIMNIWNEDYATGVPAIDQQHRLLIDRINELEALLMNTCPTEREINFAHRLVVFLESYAQMHFYFEETCMESYRCPAHACNQRDHAQFIAFIEAFKTKFHAEGFSVEAFKELHERVSSWIARHILRVDTQLLTCVQVTRPA